MALSANSQLKSARYTVARYGVVNTEEIYQGSFLAVNAEDHGTAASRGRAQAWSSSEFQIPLGFAHRRATGDTSASPEVKTEATVEPLRIEGVTVTGTTGILDTFKPVYLSDDATFTLTRPTAGLPIGYVERWITGTTCDVVYVGAIGMWLLAMAGAGQYLLHLGSYDCDTITAANIRTAFGPMPHKGKINSTFAMIDIAPAGSGGTAAINLEIDGTNVAGGVVTVATGDAKAAKKAGTAVTAANIFHEGETIDVEAATVTDMTAGRFDLYAEVTYMPGL